MASQTAEDALVGLGLFVVRDCSGDGSRRGRGGGCGPVTDHATTGSQKKPKMKPTGGSRNEGQRGRTRRRAGSIP